MPFFIIYHYIWLEICFFNNIKLIQISASGVIFVFFEILNESVNGDKVLDKYCHMHD